MSSEQAREIASADALRALNDQVRALIEQVRLSTAPPSVLAECADQVEAVSNVLTRWRHQGVCASNGLDASVGYRPRETNELPTMLYSPVTGIYNPVSPRVRLVLVDGVVRGSVEFSGVYSGPPETVHGGMLAAVFDEALSRALLANGVAAFTGTLTVRYHARAPLNASIELVTRCAEVTGRKALATGQMCVGGELIASAEGVFIAPLDADRESIGLVDD